MNIFIGCGSEDVLDKFTKNSRELIDRLSTIEGLNLCFGAYNQGLMGYAYDAFKKNNKKVCGITLNTYKDQLDMLNCDEEILVETTMDRMKEIYNKSDIMLFLPGGVGTYAEILSSIEESRTKEDRKLLILYNDEFFFTPLIKEMYWLFENKFAKKSIGEYIRIESVDDEVYRLIEKEKELWKN